MDLESAVARDFPRVKDELGELVRIPSVSAPGFDAGQVRRSAEKIAELLEGSGLRDATLLELDGAHPAVYAELPGPPGAPTVLLYAHHDVQPAGPDSDWDTPPFEPVERNGRLYGRGTSDDKCGVVTHAAVVRAFAGSPPVGIKVFIEGEEEVGSTHLEGFLEHYREMLVADTIVIADTGNWSVGIPALTTSLRGLVDCTVEVRTLDGAVHSGMFGGPVPDALMTLSRILASLHDDDGNVAVPGRATRTSPYELPEADFRESSGVVPGLDLIGTGSVIERLWFRPSISVLAIDAPPVAEAINQLVPVARAKVSMRLAPGDDSAAAMRALTEHIERAAPWGAEVTVTPGAYGEAITLDTTGPGYDAWRDASNRAYDSETIEMGAGGSIPFVSAFQERYPRASILLAGVSDPTSRYHGPNESIDLEDLRKGILTEAQALQNLAAITRS
jgi:acetylornithine deacetylase/succinyl-diaminopimelate desuccinylase-like protein